MKRVERTVRGRAKCQNEKKVRIEEVRDIAGGKSKKERKDKTKSGGKREERIRETQRDKEAKRGEKRMTERCKNLDNFLCSCQFPGQAPCQTVNRLKGRQDSKEMCRILYQTNYELVSGRRKL